MSKISWAETVRRVHQRANFRCEYCQTGQHVTGQAMHVEHIDPDGGDQLENLALACATCNLSKARAISALDHDTSEIVALFNPRNQQWVEHFEWIEHGTQIRGRTPTGRATLIRLQMNVARIVNARKVWVRAGEHPPS